MALCPRLNLFRRNRLAKVVNRTDVAAAHYPLALAPFNQAVWKGAKEDYLYLDDKKLVVRAPIRLLQCRWHEERDGKTVNRARPAIRFKFLREADARAAKKIVYQMSEPSISKYISEA